MLCDLFKNLVDEVNADNRVKWVLLAGDIKGGGSVCSDEMFADRLGRYNQFNKQVVLTPVTTNGPTAIASVPVYINRWNASQTA